LDSIKNNTTFASSKNKMEKVIVNVGKTAEGYSASIEILPGWVVGMTGSFT
jgi:hypothetical protein